MPSTVKASSWITAKALHQVQLLSCDLSELVRWESPNHAAPFWRLYQHDAPGAELMVAGRRLAMEPGQLYVIPPHTDFGSRLRGSVRQFFLHFLVEPHWAGEPGRVYAFAPTGEQRRLCSGIMSKLRADSGDLHISLLAQMLVSSVLLRFPREQWAPRYEDARVTRAVAEIKAAYPARRDNRTLAKSASLHTTTFVRLFRNCTGHAPVEFLMNLRIEEACAMLHYGDATLDEIAQRTGFCDRSHFSRIFTRRMNCPPARYRRLVNVDERLRPGA